MVKLKLHPSYAVKVNDGEWERIPRTEFRLLSELMVRRGKLVPFRELQRLLWDFEDPQESSILSSTCTRLIGNLHEIASDINWEEIIYRDSSCGYGFFPETIQPSAGS